LAFTMATPDSTMVLGTKPGTRWEAGYEELTISTDWILIFLEFTNSGLSALSFGLESPLETTRPTTSRSLRLLLKTLFARFCIDLCSRGLQETPVIRT
jgi:hypothetical protein